MQSVLIHALCPMPHAQLDTMAHPPLARGQRQPQMRLLVSSDAGCPSARRRHLGVETAQ